jgi:hypothetical protein
MKEILIKRQISALLPFFSLIFLLGIPNTYSLSDQIPKDELKRYAPRVFVDCSRCDMDYIRTEITWVNYVRERKEADIHILGTVQRTGSDGWEYTFEFIGLRNFADIQHTLRYVSSRTDTSDEIRQGYIRTLKRGLFPFILRTPIAERIDLVVMQAFEPNNVEDKWSFWVFNIGVNGGLSGEKRQNFSSISSSFSANRVTPDLKIRLGASGNFNQSHFEIDGSSITSASDRENVRGMVVKSVGDHWAVGGWVNWRSSAYNNLRSEYTTAPAVEFNLFPYAESTRRQLRFMYRLGYSYACYREETIYDKMDDHLFGQVLNVTLEVKEPWGIASTYLEGSHYFHDLTKNRLRLGGYLSLRLIKGLSLSVSGAYSRIHDQLSLPKSEASLDEILLQRIELQTDYDYHLSVGFNYTFGSVYSNVVNPRFGH